MALTRAFLRGMGLTDEQISAIIEEHTSSTDALKAQRDNYKADAEKLTTVQAELDALRNGGTEWESKYNAEHDAFEAYKADATAKELSASKRTKLNELLGKTNVKDKYIDSVARMIDLNDVELNESGEISNAEAITAKVQSEFSDFITTTSTQGVTVPTPPSNNSGGTYTIDDIKGLSRDAINANWDSIKNSLKG